MVVPLVLSGSGFAGSRARDPQSDRVIDDDIHLNHHLGPMPPYFTCLLVGLGGLFDGVTGPLLSTFVECAWEPPHSHRDGDGE
jgi:hypothetical protein